MAEDLDREKLAADVRLRERELALKERQLELKRLEAEEGIRERRRSRWREPLFLAVVAAAIAGLGNACVALVNSSWERQLDRDRAEAARILEVVKTNNDPDKAADNLRFLVDLKLVSDASVIEAVEAYLKKRTPGKGLSLPTAASPGVGNYWKWDLQGSNDNLMCKLPPGKTGPQAEIEVNAIKDAIDKSLSVQIFSLLDSSYVYVASAPLEGFKMTMTARVPDFLKLDQLKTRLALLGYEGCVISDPTVMGDWIGKYDLLVDPKNQKTPK